MSVDDRRAMKIVVLAGGISDERDISLSSGENAVMALREAGFGTVEMLDPAAPDFLSSLSSGHYDVAFIALHGRGGEDGMIQGICEYLGLPYTGSDVIASASAVDKDLSKLLYERAGIPVAAGVALRRDDAVDVASITEVVGQKSFVKPAINGSSYGVRKVKDSSELEDAVAFALQYGDKVLVEHCLEGTEVSVGVFGAGEDLMVLPIVEICMPDNAEFYDLEVKYVDPKDIHRIPARLSEGDYALVQEYARRAHVALGCHGVSRSDFIVTEEGPVILETNTIPGMTSTSLFPDELRHEGIAFSDACAKLVELALARAGR